MATAWRDAINRRAMHALHPLLFLLSLPPLFASEVSFRSCGALLLALQHFNFPAELLQGGAAILLRNAVLEKSSESGALPAHLPLMSRATAAERGQRGCLEVGLSCSELARQELRYSVLS